MTDAADPAVSERQFSDDQRFAVLTLHERALAMTKLAVDELRADSTNDFENVLAVVMPLLSYAFETAAKMAWALHRFHRSGRMPESREARRAATYPDDETPFVIKPDPNFEVPRAFSGHAVVLIIDNLTERIGTDSAQALKELADQSLHRGCLDAITAFHAITRYAMLDMLLEPDDKLIFDDEQFGPEGLLVIDGEVLGPNKLLAGQNERRFTGIVRELGDAVAVGYGDTRLRGPAAVAERHCRDFLPAMALAYWRLFDSLSRVVAEVLFEMGEIQCATRLQAGIAVQVQDWIEQGWFAPASTYDDGPWPPPGEDRLGR